MSEPAVRRVDFMGLPLDPAVSVETVCDLLQKKGVVRLVSLIGPPSFALAKKSPEYPATLQRMTYNVADAPEVASICRLLTGARCSRALFGAESLIVPFAKAAIAKGASLMPVGGQPGTEERMQGKLQAHFSGLKIAGALHGYGEFDQKIKEVLAHAPDAVLADMGGTRQEAFLVALADAGYRGIAIACEGYFEEYLAEDGFYPPWVKKWKLYTVWRLFNRPGQGMKRSLGDYLYFIARATKELANKYTPRLRQHKDSVQTR